MTKLNDKDLSNQAYIKLPSEDESTDIVEDDPNCNSNIVQDNDGLENKRSCEPSNDESKDIKFNVDSENGTNTNIETHLTNQPSNSGDDSSVDKDSDTSKNNNSGNGDDSNANLNIDKDDLENNPSNEGKLLSEDNLNCDSDIVQDGGGLENKRSCESSNDESNDIKSPVDSENGTNANIEIDSMNHPSDSGDENNDSVAKDSDKSKEDSSKNKAADFTVPHFMRRLINFLKKRFFSITFRVVSYMSLVPSIITLIKKFNRGHTMWASLSICLYFIPRIAASIFSLWCYILEEYSKDNIPEEIFVKIKPRQIDISQGFKDDTEDVMELFNMNPAGFSDTKATNSNEETDTKPKLKNNPRLVKFDENLPTRRRKPKTVGTYIETGLVNPKIADDFGGNEEFSHTKYPGMQLKDFLCGIQYCTPAMIFFHLILEPRIYRFFISSSKLWQHLKDGHDQDNYKKAIKELKKKNVKKICFVETLNKYYYQCLITHSISMLLCTMETIPSTIIEMFYWTLKSKSIIDSNLESNLDTGFFNLSITGTTFNILELVSILQSIVKVAFNISQLMHAARKMDFSRQNLKKTHRAFLVMIYFFLLTSRVMSCYLVMCIDEKGLILGIMLLIMQFFLFFVTSKDLQMGSNSNNVTLLITSLLMVFAYVPPKSKKKLSFFSYQWIMLVEMFCMFFFGYHLILVKGIERFLVVGLCVEVGWYYYLFIVAFGMFIVGWFMNLPFLQRNLFKFYKERVTEDDIKIALNDVKKKYNVDYELLTGVDGTYGQDKKAFIARHTIHLF